MDESIDLSLPHQSLKIESASPASMDIIAQIREINRVLKNLLSEVSLVKNYQSNQRELNQNDTFTAKEMEKQSLKGLNDFMVELEKKMDWSPLDAILKSHAANQNRNHSSFPNVMNLRKGRDDSDSENGLEAGSGGDGPRKKMRHKLGVNLDYRRLGKKLFEFKAEMDELLVVSPGPLFSSGRFHFILQ